MSYPQEGGGHSCRSGVSAPWPQRGSGWDSWGPNPPSSGGVAASDTPMHLERRPSARLAAEGPGELKDQYIISRLDGCLRAGGAAVGSMGRIHD